MSGSFRPSFLPSHVAVLCLFLCAGMSAHATEFFVSRTGSDAADGKTQGTAFATVQKGLDSLSPGDTLTIRPGEYMGSSARKDLGSLDRETIIRAEIPGTVVIRGDVPAPAFSPIADRPNVFVGDFRGNVQGVSENDSLTLLKGAATAAEVAFEAGSFFYDKDAGKLYVNPTDLRPAGLHAYTISVSPDHGLMLERPKKVTIDGLAFRGFTSRIPLPDSRPQYVTWGLFLAEAKECVVKNSTAWLNGGGLLVVSGEAAGGNLIADCISYGNGSPNNSEGGNVSVIGANNDTIRNCIGYRSSGTGVRIYGTATGTNAIESSLGWGNQGPDLGLKGGGLELNEPTRSGWVRNSIALSGLAGANLDHSLVGKKTVNLTEDQVSRDNVLLEHESLVAKREYADPTNFDFRLQGTSKLRRAAPDGSDRGPFPYKANIFFVRPDGDDAADGLSLKASWKTAQRAVRDLKPGDTVYFDEGIYAGSLDLKVGQPGGEPIFLRGRGIARARFGGPVTLAASHGVAFERLTFAETVRVENSSQTTFENCVFEGTETGLAATSGEGLTIRHCEFVRSAKAGLSLVGTSVVLLESNIYANKKGVAVAIGKPGDSGAMSSIKSWSSQNSAPPELAGAILYSDYNAYADRDRVWSVDGQVLPLTSLAPAYDAYSFVQKPDYEDGKLTNRALFAARGARGQSVGWHQELAGENLLYMSKPVVHSVSATTANIEWLVSRGADCEVAWGETPECENQSTFTIFTFLDLHRSFSLTGLKPGTKYYFRVKAIRMLAQPDFGQAKVVDPHYEVVSFTTLAANPPPRTLYVAPDGNDANSGLERTQAWRTVGHAASEVAPGDTVLIAGGTYIERVRVRNTGDVGLPITFRSLPDEKVIFDGNQRQFDNAWTINGKHQIVVDGFYFFNHRGEPGGTISTRLFDVVESSDITVRRCFMSGLGGLAYPASFLTGYATKNLTISNIVSILAPDGVEVSDCPGFRLENSVFVLTMICNVKLGSPATLANNIFCDSGEFKALQKIQLQQINPSVIDRNNCYFFRLPDEERVAFIMKWPEKISLAELKRRFPETDSFIANPEFAGMTRFAGMKIPAFPIDAFYNEGSTLDFPDFFATNPEVVARGIGLQPDEFKDFHFNAAKAPSAPQPVP